MYYKISEFAKKINVSIKTLQLWDEQGKLKPHHRTPGGQRVYSEDQIEEYFRSRSKNIQLSFKSGELDPKPFRSLSDHELEQIHQTSGDTLKERKISKL